MPDVANRPGQPGAKRGVGETRSIVLEKTIKGWTPREIARLLDMSTAAIYWHLARLRRDGDLEETA